MRVRAKIKMNGTAIRWGINNWNGFFRQGNPSSIASPDAIEPCVELQTPTLKHIDIKHTHARTHTQVPIPMKA